MTKEGELKKRMTKAYSDFYRGEGNYGSTVIDAIVDEAKKDFPTLEAGSFSKLPDGTIMDSWAKEVIDWKKNWFGDSS